LHKHDVINL